MPSIKAIQFSINNWGHLYSLQQAISHDEQLTGRKLSLKGRILNSGFLNNIDTAISIDFLQSDIPPNYPLINNELYEIGVISLRNKQLTSAISVNRNVFEELRKNLMEYADIEGIHIIVSLGLISNAEVWDDNVSLKIVQLDYAMKGDA